MASTNKAEIKEDDNSSRLANRRKRRESRTRQWSFVVDRPKAYFMKFCNYKRDLGYQALAKETTKQREGNEHATRLWQLFESRRRWNKKHTYLCHVKDEDFYRTKKEFAESMLNQLSRIDYSKLDDNDQCSFDIFECLMREAVEEFEHGPWYLAQTQKQGVHKFFVAFCRKFVIRSDKDLETYVQVANDFSRAIDRVIETLRTGLKQKRTMPAQVVEKLLSVLHSQGKPHKSIKNTVYYKPVSKALKLSAAKDDAVNGDEDGSKENGDENLGQDAGSGESEDDQSASSLSTRRASGVGIVLDASRKQVVLNTIEKVIYPAYERFISFLEKFYVNRTRRSPGLWSIPQGSQYYEFLVRKYTVPHMTAKEVHEIGLQQVSLLRQAMTDQCAKMGLIIKARERSRSRNGRPKTPRARSATPRQRSHSPTKGQRVAAAQRAQNRAKFTFSANHPITFTSFPHLALYVKRLPQYFYSINEWPVNFYMECLRRVKPQLPRLFSKAGIPSISLKVEEMSKHPGPGAVYTAGSAKSPGTLRTNVHNYTQRHKFHVMASALHEGIGHHFQRSYALQLLHLPPFRRKMIPSHDLAFSEGFALYLEWLGTQIEMYDDPVQELGRMNLSMIRAARMVVDTGIHYHKWSREQAIKWLNDNSFHSKYEVESEVDRMILSPGRGVSYTFGCLKMRELLDRAQKALKDKFAWTDFHDILLNGGAMPLHLLEKRFDKWLEQKLAPPPAPTPEPAPAPAKSTDKPSKRQPVKAQENTTAPDVAQDAAKDDGPSTQEQPERRTHYRKVSVSDRIRMFEAASPSVTKVKPNVNPVPVQLDTEEAKDEAKAEPEPASTVSTPETELLQEAKDEEASSVVQPELVSTEVSHSSESTPVESQAPEPTSVEGPEVAPEPAPIAEAPSGDSVVETVDESTKIPSEADEPPPDTTLNPVALETNHSDDSAAVDAEAATPAENDEKKTKEVGAPTVLAATTDIQEREIVVNADEPAAIAATTDSMKAETVEETEAVTEEEAV